MNFMGHGHVNLLKTAIAKHAFILFVFYLDNHSYVNNNGFRLLNGRNLTRNREDMWLSSYSRNSPPTRITVTFAEPILASGASFSAHMIW